MKRRKVSNFTGKEMHVAGKVAIRADLAVTALQGFVAEVQGGAFPGDEESYHMTEEAAWTVGRLLNWTTDFLREKGADSPRLDAEVLLAHARSCPRIELYTSFEEVAAEPLREAFRVLVRRRAAGEPVLRSLPPRCNPSRPILLCSIIGRTGSRTRVWSTS